MSFEHIQFNAHAGGAYRGKVYANSMPAIQNSLRHGITNVELDVACAADQEFVIAHGTALCECARSCEIEAPRLSDVFALMRTNDKLRVMFDFHPGLYDLDCPEMIARFASRFSDSKIAARSVIEVYSDANANALLLAGFKNVQYGWMPGKDGYEAAIARLRKVVAYCNENHVEIISVPGSFLRRYPNVMAELKGAGLTVYSSDWSSFSMLKVADELKIDYVTVDYWLPGSALRNYLNWLCNYAWRKLRALGRVMGVRCD